MRIILARHGRPKIDLSALGSRWVSADGFGEVVEAYHTADLHAGEQPPANLVSAASNCSLFLCSCLERSKSSYATLGFASIAHENSVFNEAPMPHARWKWPLLPITVWSILFRILWVFGFQENAERLKTSSQRAKSCAELLIKKAQTEGDVLLMGHGIMNRLIARQLRKRSWQMKSKNGDGYWSYSVFESDQ